MLLGRRNSPNITRHGSKTILYTKINQSHRLQNQNRTSSAHEPHSHLNKPKNSIHKHSLTHDQSAPKRRVAFQSINFEPKFGTSLKKIKLIVNNKLTDLPPKPPSLKGFKSLDGSYIWQTINKELSRSKSSIKSCGNPELTQCKKLTEDILMKLAVFQDSKFCPKQLIGWIMDYFHKQKSLISKIFIKRKKKKNSMKYGPPEIQKNKTILFEKLEAKQRDIHTGYFHFATSDELAMFSDFLEKLYVEKTKIKLKEIQDCLSDKMKQISKFIQPKKDSFLMGARQKPAEIANFMQDLSQFEAELGSMKKIRMINRNRFKLVNQTDMIFNRQVVKINQEMDEKSRKMSVQIVQ